MIFFIQHNLSSTYKEVEKISAPFRSPKKKIIIIISRQHVTQTLKCIRREKEKKIKRKNQTVNEYNTRILNTIP